MRRSLLCLAAAAVTSSMLNSAVEDLVGAVDVPEIPGSPRLDELAAANYGNSRW
jgi:hypothetical protein